MAIAERPLAEVATELLLGEPPEDADQWQTTLEWVSVDLIDVDLSYQRDELPRHIRNIAENFNRDLFGVPELSRREKGRFVILNGQQRIAALRLYNELGLGLPILKIRALVHDGLTPGEEALIYVRLNNDAIRVSTVDQWKARLKFGDPKATAIESIASKYDIEIARGRGTVQAVGAVEDIFTGYTRRSRTGIVTVREGADALERTFAAITESWALYDGLFRGDIISGVGLFFHRFTDEEIDYPTLYRTMANMPPSAFGSEAMKEMTPSAGTEGRRSAYAKTLATAYNRQAKIDGAGVEPLPVATQFPGREGRYFRGKS